MHWTGLLTVLVVLLCNFFKSSSSDDSILNAVSRVGVFTPFGLTQGNGERYILASIQVFKKLGYAIDMIMYEDNECFLSSCVEKTINFFRMQLEYEDFNVVLIPETQSFSNLDSYDIFFTMSIAQFPSMPIDLPRGAFLNIFYCQFPYDRNTGGKTIGQRLDAWSNYDIVVLNSRFTFDWYTKGVVPFVASFGKAKDIFVPTPVILHPAVEPYPSQDKPGDGRSDFRQQLSQLPNRDLVANIAVLGPFHHEVTQGEIATKLIRRVVSDAAFASFKKQINVFVLGKLSESNNVEFFSLSTGNTSIPNLKLVYMPEEDPVRIGKVLSECMIVWNLLSLSEVGLEPVNPYGDSFSTTLVEAMHSGCIPIATALGGTPDIVRHGYNGFMVKSEDEFVQYTIRLLGLSDGDIARMRKSAMHTAHAFGSESFSRNFKEVLSKGLRAAAVRDISRRRMPQLRKASMDVRPFSDNKVVVLLVPAVHSTLELTVRNAMHMLGRTWALQIHHSAANEAYVKQTLMGIPYVKMVPLPIPVHRLADYNRLLKSPEFWATFKPQERVLLLNTDSILLHKNIDKFMAFDFISSSLAFPTDMRRRLALTDEGGLDEGGPGEGGPNEGSPGDGPNAVAITAPVEGKDRATFGSSWSNAMRDSRILANSWVSKTVEGPHQKQHPGGRSSKATGGRGVDSFHKEVTDYQQQQQKQKQQQQPTYSQASSGTQPPGADATSTATAAAVVVTTVNANTVTNANTDAGHAMHGTKAEKRHGKGPGSVYHRLAKAGVGFGGLSLRLAGAMQRIARDYGNQTDDAEPESFFFARVGASLGLKVADRKEAYAFAWELECPDLLTASGSSIPFALQGAWNFMNLSLIHPLLEHNLVQSPTSLTVLPKPEELGIKDYPIFEPRTKKTEPKAPEPKAQDPKPAAAKPAAAKASSSSASKGSTKKKTTATTDAATTVSKTSSSTSTNFDAAWEALHNPKSVTDDKAVATLLDTLGINSPEDFGSADAEQLDKILELIKPVQKKKIAKYLGAKSS